MAGTQNQVEGLPGFLAASVLSATTTRQNSLEGIVVTSLTNRALCYVLESESVYRWFEDSTDAPSSPSVILPQDQPVGTPGRWILESAGGAGGGLASIGLRWAGANQPIPGDGTETIVTLDTIDFTDPTGRLVGDLGNNWITASEPMRALIIFGAGWDEPSSTATSTGSDFKTFVNDVQGGQPGTTITTEAFHLSFDSLDGGTYQATFMTELTAGARVQLHAEQNTRPGGPDSSQDIVNAILQIVQI